MKIARGSASAMNSACALRMHDRRRFSARVSSAARLRAVVSSTMKAKRGKPPSPLATWQAVAEYQRPLGEASEAYSKRAGRPVRPHSRAFSLQRAMVVGESPARLALRPTISSSGTPRKLAVAVLAEMKRTSPSTVSSPTPIAIGEPS